MKKSSVYTRGGDKGETSLVSGNRVSKGSSRIDLYGEVDELNSVIGIAYASLVDKKIDEDLELVQQIQSSLFDLGSNLACEVEFQQKYKLPQIPSEFIEKIESRIDEMDSVCPKIKYFILPTGDITASYLHLARTVCRRVERKMVEFSSTEKLPVNSLEYVNRLSDFLFIFSRYVNMKMKVEEVAWLAK